MTKTNRRKTVIHLIEKDAVFNTRIIAGTIANKIKKGGILL